MEALLVLAVLVLLAIPLLLVVALVMIAGLRRRVAALEAAQSVQVAPNQAGRPAMHRPVHAYTDRISNQPVAQAAC
ncbi:hypothetical protein Q0S99_09845, partial [Stenotrophomonas indicatrix]|uniref:hypothetical protein n=1 Tax=Stenotrophomonas indicatrix TaxID=2045451 RepID=UPI002656471D